MGKGKNCVTIRQLCATVCIDIRSKIPNNNNRSFTKEKRERCDHRSNDMHRASQHVSLKATLSRWLLKEKTEE